MSKNFSALLDAQLHHHSAKPALAWDGGALTFGELGRRTDGFARALAAKGVRAGDRIALTIGNHWAFAVALLAGWKLGATVAPLDVLLKADERADIVADLGSTVIVRAEDVGTEPAPPSAPLASAADGPDAAALILYTSGSTGRPKGALLSHTALELAIESWAGPVMALTAHDVVLATLPLAHSFGLNGALLAPLVRGATVVLVDRFAPDAVVEAIRRHRVTVFPGVATMFRRLLDSAELAAADLASVRIGVSGAAPCPWTLAQEWRARTGIRIVRGYGMTELFRPISYQAADTTESPDAIGRAVPGVEIRIVDDDGRSLSDGETGELLIKSPSAMECYVNAPDETREVLADGWFRTGDLATVSADGLVTIVGRKRERILRGGYSVFPPEVEAALLTHPAVAEAAVVGTPHPELGEDVAAFVTLRPGTTARPEELIAYCRDRLASFKHPRRVTILGSLPKGPTGKIQKSRLAG
ncbi:MAG: long-chain-fatty-acid--CoA ligase [Candidatus Rokuibacteriota bacterium]|nr:MAG: long-chain-fatty-acid--CoA ligase [Candidatus Rokubacteria bacterium]